MAQPTGSTGSGAARGPVLAPGRDSKVARVSALANGGLLLNGQKPDLQGIEAELKRLKKSDGVVWYHRESPQDAPSPSAMAVIKLVVQYGLPISMSSRPDFSDTIDQDGQSRPRPTGS